MNHKKYQGIFIVSDACILIDVENSGLTSAMFALSYQFAVPDILFEEELLEYHSELLQFGLIRKSMNGEQMSEIQELSQQYIHLSSNDCSAYVLARHENSLLLTGDGKLRELAKSLKIDVHGTIWLVEQMIDQKKISIEKARLAFQIMQNPGRRLPWDEAKKMLQRKETSEQNRIYPSI